MKNNPKIYNIVFVLCLYCLMAGISIAQDGNTCSFYGRVISINNRPVEGAIAVISSVGAADTTDAEGFFSFSGLSSGTYIITVSTPHRRFEDIHRTVTLPLKSDEPLQFVLDRRIYELDEVVVVSHRSKIADLYENIPSSVSVISRSEFEGKSVTIADVIEGTPGASVRSMGGLGDYTEVSLRGANANQVQVYIDGMLLNEALGGAVNLATIPLASVRSIELWRSGAPASFGVDNGSGVINIRTLDVSEKKQTFSFGYGSFNTVNAYTVFQIPMKSSQLMVTADYSSSDNDFLFKSNNGTEYNPDDDYWAKRINDKYRSINILAKYKRMFGNSILNISEHLLTNKKQLPGKDIAQRSDASLATVRNLTQVKLNMIGPGQGWLEIEPSLYHIYTGEAYKDMGGRIGYGAQDNKYKTNKISFLIPSELKRGTGISFHITPFFDYESYRPTHKLQKTIPLECDREHYGIMFDGRINTLDEHVLFSTSIRRDRYYSKYSGEASSSNKVTPEPRINHTTYWNIGGKIALWYGVSLRANYGVATRVPGFYELFGDRGATLSNEKLKPEGSEKWDIAGRFRFSPSVFPVTGFIEFAYFRNTYENMIQWYSNGGGFIFPRNVLRSYVKGTEVIWNTHFFNHFTCYGNWNFQATKVTREEMTAFLGKKLPNRPQSYGNVKVEYPLGIIVPFWQMNRKSSYYIDRINHRRGYYPGRTFHDAGVIFSLKKMKVSLLIQNMTDEHTFDILGMPNPGRSYTISVFYTAKGG